VTPCIYTIIIRLCVTLTLISILEDRGPANNAGCNHLPEEFGSLCIRLFHGKGHRDLCIYTVDSNREFREIKAVTMDWECR
jgi:hypothetical protein